MLQGIRASTLTMPSFGQNMSMTGYPKMEGYGDTEPWSWPQHSNSHPPSYPDIFDPSMYTNFTPHLAPPSSVQPRHHSIATSHVIPTDTATPPPPTHQIAGNMVKAQPAFKPTWNGFLDTTKDAMTIVEAALQGRLNHISRRPHDKERAEMLTSGTILVYEENASGIKRWTDAVHWSPSRVMNNCLIYRQLVRALKPDEKKTALNPSCGAKRKRREGTSPSVTKTGDNVNNSEDEYENPSFDSNVARESTPSDSLGKVYANFAQTLSPDQQRRFCGSLIDSYEFKEGGLMKKTISVKYQGTHHHVISYYSLEDVVNGKLKRPFQDPKLADVQPRAELLNGWKISLEDEESKDMPLAAGYPPQLQHSHLQHQVVGSVTQAMGVHGVVQSHTPLHMQVPEYWQGGQVQAYSPAHHSPQPYATPQPTSQYVAPPPAHQYSAPQTSPQQYSSPQSSASQYQSQPRPYSSEPQSASAQHYSQPPPPPPPPSQYPGTQHAQIAPRPQYAVSQASAYEVNISAQQPPQRPVSQHDQHRRASAPVNMQSYGQPQYHASTHPQTYYMADQKYPTNSNYGF